MLQSGDQQTSDTFATLKQSLRFKSPTVKMQFKLSALLLLFAFTQSYVWTKKKKDKEAFPSYRRPGRPAAKRKPLADAQIVTTETTTVQFNTTVSLKLHLELMRKVLAYV